MSSKDAFKYPEGSYEHLNANNYLTWSNSTRHCLPALHTWNIIAGEEIHSVIPGAGSGLSGIARAKKDLED